MNISTIDVDKVKELLDSYWKKWEPYSQGELTRNYIHIAKEDFLYRVNLYNDFIKRKDLSHFYPFRTIFETLVKFEYLLNLGSSEREKWLCLDILYCYEQISKNEPNEDKELNQIIQLVKKNYTDKKVERRINIECEINKSKIFEKSDYNIYRVLSSYDHSFLLAPVLLNEYGGKDNDIFTHNTLDIIMVALEKLIEIKMQY